MPSNESYNEFSKPSDYSNTEEIVAAIERHAILQAVMTLRATGNFGRDDAIRDVLATMKGLQEAWQRSEETAPAECPECGYDPCRCHLDHLNEDSMRTLPDIEPRGR